MAVMTVEKSDRAGEVAAHGGVLANRDFVKVWSGETVSVIGSQVTELAFPLTAIVTLHAGAFQIGLLNVARYTPYVLLSLFAGVWFDRHRRRPVLVAANLGRTVLVGLVPLAAMLHLLSMGLLYTVAFTVGILTVLFDVGILSYLPGLVDKRHLAEANSKIATSYSVAGIAGPGLAGFLVGTLTAPVALAVDAVSYLFSAGSLAAIRRAEPAPRTPAERESIAQSIVDGLRTVVGNRILRHLAAQSGLFNLFENVVVTIFLVYAVRHLGLRPTPLGVVVGAGSVGALIGALTANRLRTTLGFGRTLRISTIAACLSPLLLLLPSGSGVVSLVALGAALAIHGVNLAVFNVNALTLRQTVTPHHLLGRMNASYRLMLFGTVPLGALLGGSLAGVFGLRLALVVGVLGLAAPIAWIPFSPVFKLRDMPDGPLDGDAAAPAPPGPDDTPTVVIPRITANLPSWANLSTAPLHTIAPPGHGHPWDGATLQLPTISLYGSTRDGWTS